jgi:hypothetical protein
VSSLPGSGPVRGFNSAETARVASGVSVTTSAWRAANTLAGVFGSFDVAG